MLKVSKQQVLERWNNLPDILKEAIFSEHNAEVLWQICESQHLSEEKINIVAMCVGDVIMGFIHPEDLAKEIKESLNINMEIANAISREVELKIFSQIKKEIDSVYAPLPGNSSEDIVDLRKKSQEVSKQIIPSVPKEGVSAPVKASEAGKEIPKILSTQETPKPSEPKQVIPSLKIKTESDGPIIIHKHEEVAPILTKKRSLGGLFSFLTKNKKEETPITAKIEISYSEEKSKTQNLDQKKYQQPQAPLEPTIPKPINAIPKVGIILPSEKTQAPVFPKPSAAVKPETSESSLLSSSKYRAEQYFPKSQPVALKVEPVKPLESLINFPAAKEPIKTNSQITIDLSEQKPNVINSKPRIVHYTDLTTAVPIPKPQVKPQQEAKPQIDVFFKNQAIKDVPKVEIKAKEVNYISSQMPQAELKKEPSKSPEAEAKNFVPPIPPSSQSPKPLITPIQPEQKPDFKPLASKPIIPEITNQPQVLKNEPIKIETPKINIIAPEPKIENQNSSKPFNPEVKSEIKGIPKTEIKVPSVEIKTEKQESENGDVVDLRTFEKYKK